MFSRFLYSFHQVLTLFSSLSFYSLCISLPPPSCFLSLSPPVSLSLSLCGMSVSSTIDSFSLSPSHSAPLSFTYSLSLTHCSAITERSSRSLHCPGREREVMVFTPSYWLIHGTTTFAIAVFRRHSVSLSLYSSRVSLTHKCKCAYIHTQG